MAGFIKGLDAYIQQNKEKQEAKATGAWIRTLALRDGDTAFIRFLTDGKDFIAAPVHSIVKETPNRTFRTDVYCNQSDTQKCIYCADGVPVTIKVFAWVYVYYIYHKFQNPRLDVDPNAPRWATVKVGSGYVYKEDVNKPMLFKIGKGKGGVYINTLNGYYEEYKTLCDRCYKWSRNGATKADTTYALLAKEPTPIPEEVDKIASQLPPLEDVVTGKITTMDLEGKEDAEEVVETVTPSVKKDAKTVANKEKLF